MTQLQFPESRYASRLFLCGRPPVGQLLTFADQVPRLAYSFLQFHVHLRINTVQIPCANWFYVLLITVWNDIISFNCLVYFQSLPPSIEQVPSPINHLDFTNVQYSTKFQYLRVYCGSVCDI
jgi:hypothetical protein